MPWSERTVRVCFWVVTRSILSIQCTETATCLPVETISSFSNFRVCSVRLSADVRMLSTRSVWDCCLESDGTTESDMMKCYNGSVCPISYPVDVFGHVARLDDDTPVNMALQLHINISLNRPSDRTWRRPPGRTRNKWLDQLRNDSTRPTADLEACCRPWTW